MNNADPRIQQAMLNARTFIGFTKLEHLIHADPSGAHSLGVLERLVAVERELRALSGSGGAAVSPRQLDALTTAVSTTQDVVRLVWKHHHGTPLPSKATALRPVTPRMTKVMA